MQNSNDADEEKEDVGTDAPTEDELDTGDLTTEELEELERS